MLVNDVFRLNDEGVFRVLWVSIEHDVLVLIRIDISTAVPVVMNYAQWLAKKQAQITPEEDPFEKLRMILNPTPKQIEKRDYAWKVISTIVSHEPEVYSKKARVDLLKAAVDYHGVNQRTVYNYLKSYWQKGKCLNALLPGFHNSGAPGRERVATEKALGRPSSKKIEKFIITERDKKYFDVALKRYYKTRKEVSLSWVYKKMLKENYSIRDEVTGEYQLKKSYPTESQFRYWTKKLLTPSSIIKSRKGEEVFNKDFRGILSTAASALSGPGEIFEIDATMADVYLVSRANRYEIVGRPTLYIVTDVFSRMIVGFYVGFEHASWVSACLALETVVEDKKTLCERYGKHIQKTDWPVAGLPQKILADGAELKSYSSDRLVSLFGVETLNAAPYRADWKGVVESKFRLIQQSFKPYVEGYVPNKFNARLDHDYRLDATLDIDQFNQIILELILSYNNTHWIDSYDRTAEMLADSVSPIPIELWRWGMAKKTGALRNVSVQSFRLGLLPLAKATVMRTGLSFKGLYYSAPELVQQELFVKGKSHMVEVSYDPRNISQIYILNSSGVIEARLTDRSRAFLGLSLYEYQQIKKIYRIARNDHEHEELTNFVQTDNRIEGIIRQAREERNSQKEPSTKAERLKHISSNREKARKEERDQSFDSVSHGHLRDAERPTSSPGNRSPYQAPSKIARLIKPNRGKKEMDDDKC
ncbi:MAG: transposase [Bacteroidales bacterium]|jgi:hypothetical protein|nr:transposase [Bacteroidales bacterium]